MLFFVLACFTPAFFIAVSSTAMMRRIAPRMGLIDQPAERKVHKTPTPMGGGIGIWLGVILTVACGQLVVWWILRQPELPAWLPDIVKLHLPGVMQRSLRLWLILGCGTVLFVMGLLDDKYNLSWKPRLGIQFLVAIILVLGGDIRATVFAPIPAIGIALSVIWIMLLINSFNFLDNMDALSAGIGLIAALMFAFVMLTGTMIPRWLVSGLLLILAGSLTGFLVHNRPPAKIFMGDSGSQFLGMLMGTLTLLGTFYDESTASRHVILAPLCVLAIPLYDTCSVILIRLAQGRSPFHPDKSHFSHRLTALGLSKPKAVMTVHLATITTGLGGILLYRVPDWASAIIIVALILCVLSIVGILEAAVLHTPNDQDKS
ncbi:MAG: MraY family glycosyltransferase [Planctomycetaceae bacterium]|jgi:UDP-GlcNAc:undecaprenyl-phosphate/decaprenyl-phosphate GlcNAc-1-phosphate transferase|nr:undecaprenyl/decaprenyl-phosphate alpha-N-acetylglucosaminyl 1-phosphate transferase [bacterium]MDG2391118.1 MraY family glycosyltransferase [Planctomycetaceae bacterium]